MSLIGTPADVLTPILELVELEDLARLFCVGSRPLLRRLQQSRLIRRIKKESAPLWLPENAVLRRNRTSLIRFSQLSFLAYFPRIEDLHLDFTGQSAVLDTPEVILPLSLRSLVLKMRGGWELLWDTPNRCARPLNRFWPRMHTLLWADLRDLDHRTCTDDAQQQVGKSLPRRLERLSLGNFLRLPHLLVEALPPNILYLEINSKERSQEHGKTTTPPLLQSLVLNTAVATFGCPFKFPSPDMQSFAVHPGAAIQCSDWNIPPFVNLTSLDMPHAHMRIEDFVQLPRTLLTLIIDRAPTRTITIPITNECIAQLPRGLTHLELKAPQVTSIALTLLPPNLQYLFCDFDVSRDLDVGIAGMPKSLTTFIYIGATWGEKDEFLTDLLPASIRKLEIHYIPLTHVKHAPKSATALTYPSSMIKMLPEDFSKLPQTLLSLSFQQTHFAEHFVPQSDDIVFPPILQELTIQCQNFTLTEAMSRNLPKTLTFLHLATGITACCLPNLPPSLTYFYTRSVTPSAIITRAIASEYEAALASRQPGYDGPALPFHNIQSDEEGLMVTASELIARTEALMPRSTINFGCDHYDFSLDAAFLAPLGPHLTGLDMTLNDWELVPSVPPPKTQESPVEVESSAHALPSLAPSSASTTATSTHTLTSQSRKPVSLPESLSFGLAAAESALVPRLKTLIIHSSTGSVLCAASSMQVVDYQALPVTLTKLDIHDAWYLQKLRFFSDYPDGVNWIQRMTNLKYLRVPRRYDVVAPSEMPPALESFKSRNFCLFQDGFQHLPRSLTHLECGQMVYDPVQAPFLPPFHLLPSTLKRVILHQKNVDVSGPCLALAQLATQGAFTPETQNWISFLSSTMARDLPIPSTLTFLDLDSMIITDKFFTANIPSTITSMSLKTCMSLTTDSVPHWPKSLTSVHIGSLAFTRSLILVGNEVEKPQVYLPTHSISVSTEPLDFSDPKPEPPPEDASFDWNFIKQQIARIGPPNLTDLNVSLPGVSKDNQWTLALAELKKKRWTTIDLPFNLGFDDSCLSRLPSSVTVLRLPRCRGISPFGARSLPRSLTELVLTNWSPNNNAIPQLPPGLTKLEIAPIESALTDDCIKSLPRGLIDLNLRTTSISDTSLPDLPSTLKRLKLKAITLTGKMFRPAPASTTDKRAGAPAISQAPASLTGASPYTAEPRKLDFKTVTISSLVEAAFDFLPCSLETIPTIDFNVEPFALIAALPKTYEHLQLPAPQIDTYHILKVAKPGVAYRIPLFAAAMNSAKPLAPLNARVAPRISTAAASVSRDLAYAMVSPWSSNSLKPTLLRVTWTDLTNASVDLSQLPKDLTTFFCMHAHIKDNDVAELPQSLKSLGLPDSNTLSLVGLKYVPPFLKELHIKLVDFNPSVPNFIEIININNDVGKRILALLPQTLQHVIWGGITYTGVDTCSLKRPTETRDDENSEE